MKPNVETPPVKPAQERIMMAFTAVSAGLLTAGVGLLLRRLYRGVEGHVDEFLEAVGVVD